MGRTSESEAESLGFSVSSDTDAQIAPRRGGAEDARRSPPAEDTDLQEYARSLGADPAEEHLAWVVKEAFEAPLPTSWTEHVDAEGCLYFFNQVTEQSTWSHPMDDVYRELIGIIREVRPLTTLGERAQAVREHLIEVHGRALAGLEGWSGPYNSDTGQYYHNERLGQSTWISPMSFWEYELAIRHSVLHRSALAGYSWPEEPPEPNADGGSDLLTSPVLHLPIGLARCEDDEKMSARSFFTARESVRSGNSARSEHVFDGHARSRAASAGQPSSVREECDEKEVTFGAAGGSAMPVMGKT